MKGIQSFLAGQFRKPSGWFGSAVMSRVFDLGNRRLVLAAHRELQLEPHDVALEIGFGSGDSLLTLAALEAEARLFGLDYSAEMVAETARRARSSRLDYRVHLFQGDALHLPFRTSLFDKVLTINTIYFWPDLDAGLREIGRVLKPYGRIVIGFRSRRTLGRLAFVRESMKLYDAPEVEQALVAAGFINARVSPRHQYGLIDNIVASAVRPIE